MVAPFTGAWIETGEGNKRNEEQWSPLSQGRGLKQRCKEYKEQSAWVAPFTGAWIETPILDL